jgi:tripartite-type tricarboxylate transporter receptor subunit TctC
MESRNSNAASPMDRRKFLLLASSAVAAGVSALVALRAGAQSAAFPHRPISIVVPFAPATATDIVARLFASELPAHLGQNVIVDNKPGAGGSIGTAAVARAKNDGYTLCMVANPVMAINPSLYRNLPYDPLKDLTPIIKLASIPSFLLVSAQSPITSVHDLMKRMKERTEENSFRYSSVGVGTTQHLLGALLAKLAGAPADHVPYRGPADAMTAVTTGDVDFSFATPALSGAFTKSGRLRAISIASAERSRQQPDVPTLSSAGLQEFTKTDSWYGVVGPKDLPDAVLQTLHQAFSKVLGTPDIRTKLAGAGYDPVPLTSPGEFALFIRDQHAFWGDLVRASGATAD